LNPLEGEKNNINYLIVGYLVEEVDDNVEILQELHEELIDMRLQHTKDNNDIMNYLRQIR
jgi:hypothetical protein